MAKPTKHATQISVGVGTIALIGIIIGLLTKNALFPLIALLPTVVYEVYRVEGKSTRSSSWGLLIVIIAELALFIFNISFDLAGFLGKESQDIQGYEVQLSDIKIIGPVLLAVFSATLFKNTRGRYTKALSVVIFITAFVIVYIMNPEIFTSMLRFATQEGIDVIGN